MRIIAIFVFTLWYMLGVPQAYAGVSYTVAPLVIDVDAEARDIITKPITITNTGDVPITIYPTVNNISLSEGGTIEEFVQAVESDRTRSLASWLEISRKGIDLKVGETYTTNLTIRVNPMPVPGEYHAFVGFGYGGNRDEAERQVKNGGAPGTIVTVAITEDKLELLKLSRFIIDRFITNTENQAAVYTVKNPGDEPLSPKGDVIFYDNRGVEVASIPVNTEGVTIPPGGEHEFTATVPVAGLFGKYKAFLTVEYGTAQLASVQDTAFFYVFPLKMVIIVFGVVSVMMVLIALLVHRKYFSDIGADADTLVLHLRDTKSEDCEHDIDLKQK